MEVFLSETEVITPKRKQFSAAWKVNISRQITVGELTPICQQEMATDVVFYRHFHLLVWFLGPSSGVSVEGGSGDSMPSQRRNSWTSRTHTLLLLSLNNFQCMQEHVPVKFSTRIKVIFPSLRNFRILQGYRHWLKQHLFLEAKLTGKSNKRYLGNPWYYRSSQRCQTCKHPKIWGLLPSSQQLPWSFPHWSWLPGHTSIILQSVWKADFSS